jgi:hypothetical protein
MSVALLVLCLHFWRVCNLRTKCLPKAVSRGYHVYIAAPEPNYVRYLFWKHFDVIWTYHCRVLRSVGVHGIVVVLRLLTTVMDMHVVPCRMLGLYFMFVLKFVHAWYVQGTVVGRHAETGETLSANHVYPVGGVPLWCITDTVCTRLEWVPMSGPFL